MAVVWSPPDIAAAGGWRNAAECQSADSALFFPVGTTGSALRQIEAAKAVCLRCPVREPCLDFALRTRQDAGVWGGRTEEERRTLRRSRRRSG